MLFSASELPLPRCSVQPFKFYLNGTVTVFHIHIYPWTSPPPNKFPHLSKTFSSGVCSPKFHRKWMGGKATHRGRIIKEIGVQNWIKCVFWWGFLTTLLFQNTLFKSKLLLKNTLRHEYNLLNYKERISQMYVPMSTWFTINVWPLISRCDASACN